MPTRRQLADAQLVGRGRDRAGGDRGAQDLEPAAGGTLANDEQRRSAVAQVVQAHAREARCVK
jgi:hypothetical protein